MKCFRALSDLAVVPLLLLLGMVLQDEGFLGLGDERVVAGLVAHEDGPQEEPDEVKFFVVPACH